MNQTKPRAKPSLPASGSTSSAPGPALSPGQSTPRLAARPGGVDSSRRRPKVRLNDQWERFTAPKRDLIMLGTVQCGHEIGALARTPQGGYVQINGGVIRELNRSRIKAAIARATHELSARLAQDAAARTEPPPLPPSAPGVVTSIDMPLELACETDAGPISEGGAAPAIPGSA